MFSFRYAVTLYVLSLALPPFSSLSLSLSPRRRCCFGGGLDSPLQHALHEGRVEPRETPIDRILPVLGVVVRPGFGVHPPPDPKVANSPACSRDDGLVDQDLQVVRVREPKQEQVSVSVLDSKPVAEGGKNWEERSDELKFIIYVGSGIKIL